MSIDWSAVVTAETKEAEANAAKVEAIKAEANRRILLIAKEHTQRNLIAQAAILADRGRANWTEGELAAWDAGAAIWAQISAIRAQCNALEVQSPPPADPTDDNNWP